MMRPALHWVPAKQLSTVSSSLTLCFYNSTNDQMYFELLEKTRKKLKSCKAVIQMRHG